MKFWNRPYGVDRPPAYRVLQALAFGLFVWLFLWFFAPFGLNQ